MVNWNLNELEKGDSSVVKLLLDSKPVLIVVKTLLNSHLAELIRLKADIHKTLKHPLILELHGEISERRGHNSAIVTEFAGNGSLASHLPPAKCRLSGANRITTSSVGITLALQIVHSIEVPVSHQLILAISHQNVMTATSLKGVTFSYLS
jgi:serine/threonine protein kinase